MDENKKSLSEEDIKNRYITPALDAAKWDKSEYRMEYYFTAGRVLIQGKQHARKEGKKADYLLLEKRSARDPRSPVPLTPESIFRMTPIKS